MSELAAKECQPCRGGVPPLSVAECQRLLTELDAWQVVDQHHLEKRYTFPDFVSSLRWVNAIGDIAEQEGHHPDISLGWGYVGVKIFTHKIDNLTESDFILAAKLDAAHKKL